MKSFRDQVHNKTNMSYFWREFTRRIKKGNHFHHLSIIKSRKKCNEIKTHLIKQHKKKRAKTSQLLAGANPYKSLDSANIVNVYFIFLQF